MPQPHPPLQPQSASAAAAAAAPPPVDLEFTRRLPKIELHAHLTGSISRQVLHDVWAVKNERDGLQLKDPLTAISLEHDIHTFFPLFSTYIYNLISDLASIRHSTQSVLDDFQADGVHYLELRTTPRAIPSQSITEETYITTILSILTAHNTNPTSTFKANLILSIDRRNTLAQAEHVVDLALKYRHQGVVGLDLCGDPSKGDVSIFTPAFLRAKAAGLPLTLHFAEIEASATPAELDTLLSWNPSRIGHVIHVNEVFEEKIKQANIGLELCLSCNVKAKMIAGMYSDHHFGSWRHSALPLALCTDDVGVFGSPLSEEYHLAATHFGLSRWDVKTLAERAVACIFGGEEEKARLREVYRNFEI